MDLKSVDSSMIRAVGYDPKSQEMEVLFNSGKCYTYYDVPQEEYDGLMAASSKGSYMRSNIIDIYSYHMGTSKRRR